MASTEQRLNRLLALVPYLLAHPGIGAAEAAADFDITETQLRKDLDLLWMCGLPGHGPGDLIDLSYEGDTVSVIFDAGMSRPLRLTAQEALALVVALRTLAETPGLTDTDAVRSALAKVEAAAGGAVDDAAVEIALDSAARAEPLLRRALDDRRAVALRYYTAARDETSERTVDPVRLFDVDGVGYLQAWCRRAEGIRVFRLERIDDVRVLDEPALPPTHVEAPDVSEGVYQPAAEHLLAVLSLGPAYAWVADYYVPERVEQSGDALQISLRVSDPAWVRALVLGSAGQVRVLAPPWLAESIRAEAAAALAAYEPQ